MADGKDKATGDVGSSDESDLDFSPAAPPPPRPRPGRPPGTSPSPYSYDEAMIVLKCLLKHTPQNPSGQEFLGIVQKRLGRPCSGLQSFISHRLRNQLPRLLDDMYDGKYSRIGVYERLYIEGFMKNVPNFRLPRKDRASAMYPQLRFQPLVTPSVRSTQSFFKPSLTSTPASSRTPVAQGDQRGIMKTIVEEVMQKFMSSVQTDGPSTSRPLRALGFHPSSDDWSGIKVPPRDDAPARHGEKRSNEGNSFEFEDLHEDYSTDERQGWYKKRKSLPSMTVEESSSDDELQASRRKRPSSRPSVVTIESHSDDELVSEDAAKPLSNKREKSMILPLTVPAESSSSPPDDGSLTGQQSLSRAEGSSTGQHTLSLLLQESGFSEDTLEKIAYQSENEATTSALTEKLSESKLRARIVTTTAVHIYEVDSLSGDEDSDFRVVEEGGKYYICHRQVVPLNECSMQPQTGHDSQVDELASIDRRDVISVLGAQGQVLSPMVIKDKRKEKLFKIVTMTTAGGKKIPVMLTKH